MLHYSLRGSWLQYVLCLLTTTAIRFFPWRPPNVEPILATVMPLGSTFGILDTALFAALNIVLFDIASGAVGSWTVIAAFSYALVAGLGTIYLRRVRGVKGYLSYAIIGTILYDALTGLTMGPIMFGQPLKEAFVGQIPFTMNHLLGNLILALVLSPLIERWIVKNPMLEQRVLRVA